MKAVRVISELVNLISVITNYATAYQVWSLLYYRINLIITTRNSQQLYIAMFIVSDLWPEVTEVFVATLQLANYSNNVPVECFKVCLSLNCD